jgi:hypothetical protein
MPDPITIAGAVAALKPTFEAIRSALGMLKDAKDLLPADDQRQAAISQALVTAESSSRIAEAEIAKALGYELCKCDFPPTIMLTVGEHNGRPKIGPSMNVRSADSTRLDLSLILALPRNALRSHPPPGRARAEGEVQAPISSKNNSRLGETWSPIPTFTRSDSNRLRTPSGSSGYCGAAPDQTAVESGNRRAVSRI